MSGEDSPQALCTAASVTAMPIPNWNPATGGDGTLQAEAPQESSSLLLDPRTRSWMQEEAPLPGQRQCRSSGPRTVEDPEFQDNLAEVMRRLTEREAVVGACLHRLAL